MSSAARGAGVSVTSGAEVTSARVFGRPIPCASASTTRAMAACEGARGAGGAGGGCADARGASVHAAMHSAIDHARPLLVLRVLGFDTAGE